MTRLMKARLMRAYSPSLDVAARMSGSFATVEGFVRLASVVFSREPRTSARRVRLRLMSYPNPAALMVTDLPARPG